MTSNRWEQEDIIHCPWKGCKGMLLRHLYHFQLKCSDCNRYWMQHITLTQSDKPTRVRKSDISRKGDKDVNG